MAKKKQGKESAEELNKVGNDYYARGDYDKAREYYEKALQADEKYHWGYYNLGLVYKALKEYDRAIENYKKSADLIEDNLEALNQIGICYYDQGKYDEAESYYKKALDKNKDYHYAFYNLSLVENERGNKDKRKQYLEKALKIKPDYSSALNELGNYHYDNSDYDKAEDCYQRALSSDPNNKYAHYNMGLIYESRSEYEDARNHYMESLKHDPDYDLAKTALEKVNKTLQNQGVPLETKGETPTGETKESYLDKMGRNLNRLAGQGKLGDLLGREKEIQIIFEILHKRFKNNPVLIGPPGVGKTAIVEGVAQLIVEGKVPEPLKNKVIIEVNTGLLVAGTKYRGDFEIKIKKILDEARDNNNIILFIDEIHSIVGAGRVEDSNLDLAQMLKPALQNGEITCIGATTTDEYRRYIEKDAALERRFYPVHIAEPAMEATKDILNHNIPKIKQYYNVAFTKENVDDIVKLSRKYIRKRYFPDKAIDIMEKIASRKSLRGDSEVSPHDIREMISESTGTGFIDDDRDEIERLLNMEEQLKNRVIGQDHAISLVCNFLRITKRRLDLRPERPDGVFMFAGPTGVGKTFLAKCLCDYLYGDDSKLIQLDMSEYSEPHSVSKLVGAPPGYIGHDNITPLTSQIDDNPSSILLLDEIEKADISVIRLFLQIFEEGKITDSHGRKVYFSDVTVVMTSNALVKNVTITGFNSGSEGGGSMDRVVEALSKFFPREFLNRIDEIVVFNRLTEQDVKDILLKTVYEQTRERFKTEGVSLEFDDTVAEAVMQEGYSPELGVRNLHRAFERLVLSPLVNRLYRETKKGLKLKLSFKEGGVVIDT